MNDSVDECKLPMDYYIQAATDTQSHIILGCDLSHNHNDMNKLSSIAKIALDNIGIRTTEAAADKGRI